MTFEEFVEFYNTYGKTPNQISKPNHSLTPRELETKYQKYIRSEDKKQQRKEEQIKKQRKSQREKAKEIDFDLIKVYSKVDKRDNFQCRLIAILDFNAYRELTANAWDALLCQIDHAHYLRRLSYPHLKYDIDNIVLLNRYSHSMIDQMCNPVNGKPITKEEHENWWKLILGNQYTRIMEKI